MSHPTEILQKLASCKPYRDRLETLRDRARVARPEDWETWGLVERNLQLALECAIDVGEMVISWKRWEWADENKDVFRVLGAHGALSPELAARMMSAAGFRNVLVHEYGILDVERVRRAVLHELGDLDAYAQAIARFVRDGS